LAKKLVARRFTVTLRLGNFERIGHPMQLPSASQHLQQIQRAAAKALTAMLQPDMVISGCGIIATDIESAGQHQLSLFESASAEDRALPLWQAMQEARNRFGNQIVRPAITLTRPAAQHSSGQRFGYPLIICK